MAPTEEMNLVDFDRSNKGASKQRRDQINAEIATMRDLLPLAETARQRLSQLQIMSLTCVYIRKCNVLQKLFRSKAPETYVPDSIDFFQALTGFLLVTTREGKLLYISENVTDYLGHSMVDMKTQGDSLYDIVDKRDQRAVQAQLLQAGSAEGKEPRTASFFCRMNMSRTLKRQSGFGDVKVMHVRGHFIPAGGSESGCAGGEGQSVFMATCSPLITPDVKENLVQNNTMVFKTVHQLDMAFVEVTKTGEYHLNQTSEELCKTSWYSLLHPEDIHEAKEKHVQLIRSNHEMGCMMTVRMLRKDGSHFWVNIVMHVRQASLAQNDEPMIVCINQVIEDHEAYQIKTQSQMFSIYSGRAHELWGAHMAATGTPDIPASNWAPHQNGIMPMAGYPSSVSGFVSPQSHPPIYPFHANNNIAVVRNGKLQPIPPFSPANKYQSDELKAMLKRKIQGPQPTSCRPNKIPRVSWNTKGNGGSQVPIGLDQTMPPMQFSTMPIPVCGESQGQSMQVMQPTYHKLGVMMAKKSVEAIGCRKPILATLPKSEMMVNEQVVPEVNVPDSFLTPDPSPISSPDLSKTYIKTEVMDPEEATTTLPQKSSVSILQALEKLASQPQLPGREPKTPITLSTQPPVVRRKRELPIFDAFDIDNFFATLGHPDMDSKVSIKVEEMATECKVKEEIFQDTECCSNSPDFVTLRNDKCESPSYAEQGSQSPLQESQFSLGQESRCDSDDCQDKEDKPATTPCTKDMVVSSTIVSSPKSIGSAEHFDDLLSCFSDDGLDLSPLQMDPRSTALESSVSEDLLDDHTENYPSSLCSSLPRNSPSIRSPEGSSSYLPREDDLVDDASVFTLAMALDALDQQEEVCQGSNKPREVPAVPEEFNILLGAF